MSGSGWENDDDFLDDGEGDDDYEDDAATAVAAPAASTATASAPRPSTPAATQRPRNGQTRFPNGQPARQVKVKPMPTGMRRKWPDVRSVILTLDSGNQVVFFRGA